MPSSAAQDFFRQGNEQFLAKELRQAADFYRQALELDPQFAAASFNLGCAVHALEGPAEALPHFVRAAALRPDWCEARSNLGVTLAGVGRMPEAAAELQAASGLKPQDARIRNDLGLALSALGRGEEAFVSFREAIRLDPGNPETHNNLGVLFERFGRTSEAIASLLEALKLRPAYPEAHNNLAGAYKSQGRHAEAVAHLGEALRLNPRYTDAHSSLLFSLCYPAGASEQEVFAEHCRFGAAYRFPVGPHGNHPSPERPLKVGYVSADFRDHAVSRFIEPVLRHHDRESFRIFCYANVSVADARSTRIAGLCDRFVNIAGVSDAAAEATIREDGIDILVDLSGHTAGNRLPLFARKPAPLQVTWLGYPQTTGLAAIDYRITDAGCDPPGKTDHLHTEKLLRLPSNFSCFAPDEDAPEAGELPAPARGHLTFGSFNNPAKITPETVALWASALHGVAGSRMLIKGYSLADAGTRERFVALFAARGIPAERLELIGNTASYRDHLALYRRVDIALDTFPYNGTTTTCEALWMGVPVVTLAGETHRSRVGASLLASVGLPELVAGGPQEYADIAIALAGDFGRLQSLRATLRSTMSVSTLTDGARFTRDLESAYRDIWRSWCAERASLPLQRGGQVGDGARPASTGPHPHPDPPLEGEGGRAKLGLSGEGDGRLDLTLKSCLAALHRDPRDLSPLGEIEQALNRHMADDLREALDRDAARLGAARMPRGEEPISHALLEETAKTLLSLGFVTPADLICRYLTDRGRGGISLSRTLGEIALRIGQPGHAAACLRDAVAAGDASIATKIALTKADESARLTPPPPEGRRHLLVKAWGYGFWSDVNHVLGQLLLAEITGRVPVPHWGGNSLFGDDPSGNAFHSFFQPLNGVTIADVAATSRSFFPPKWHPGNLMRDEVNKSDGPWSRFSSLHALERGEDLVVSDFHYSVHDLVPWIPAGHHLHGMTTDQVYLYLYRRYLKVRPEIAAKAEAIYGEKMAGHPHLALHVRGGDKGGEDPNLKRLNELYHPEIERYLQRVPEARLFLLTDDREILAGYRQRYSGRVVHTGAVRTGTGEGVHYQQHASRYQLGEEVIVDALLATRCDAFIGNGLSNVSCAVAQMKEWGPEKLTLLGARLDRLRQFTLYRS